MAKQPYIPFYLGDYIKDTRVLPLNVKGGWVDLILAMWDNNPKGEITGTIEDFSRIMNCQRDEAILVIQTLKQKNFFDYTEIGDGVMQIVSRKQKKMEKLSEIRKTVGKTGGNPKLVNQNLNQDKNQKDKLIPEYENEYEIDNVLKKGVQGEGFIFPKNDYEIELTEMDIGRAVQFLCFAKGVKDADADMVVAIWGTFKSKNFTGKKSYTDNRDIIRHFFESLKFQKIDGKPVKKSVGKTIDFDKP